MKFDLISAAVAGGVFIVFIMTLIWRYRSGQYTAALRYSDTNQLNFAGSSWRVRLRWVPVALRILAVGSLLIAFARPQLGLEIIRTAREGIAIQMVIDRSSSMLQPMTLNGDESNRLQVVKEVFREFVVGGRGGLEGRSNDMIGLTSFAGFVEENAPLTLDHDTLVNFAQTIRPASRVEDGTMIGDALYFSTLRLISVDELLKQAEEKNNTYKVKSKIIILLTDGQQTPGGQHPLEAAEFARSNGIKVYTVAITSDSKYVKRDSLLGQFFSFQGRELDTTLLEQIAERTGGMFAKASSGEMLLKIYNQIDQMEKSQFAEKFTTFKEQFPMFIFLALIFLMGEIVLRQTLFRKIP